MKIFPSLASANQMRLGDEIEALGNHGYLHFDIEDGNFVPNITFGMKTIKAAVAMTDATLDAHLMVKNPMQYIEELKEYGFGGIAFHWEIAEYPALIINAIKSRGIKAGIALNPRTCVNEISPYLNDIDYILVMTSEPDGKGDLFQPKMLKKVEWLAENCKNNQDIIVDGGISNEEFTLARKAKATGVVLGRAVFSSDCPLNRLKYFNSL